MTIRTSIYERLVNALGRVEYKRSDDFMARDMKTIAALKEVIEPELKAAWEAGRDAAAKACRRCKGANKIVLLHEPEVIDCYACASIRALKPPA